MIENQDLLDAREQIQNDLLCLLDNFGGEVQDRACQIVVDRFKPLIKNDNKKSPASIPFSNGW